MPNALPGRAAQDAVTRTVRFTVVVCPAAVAAIVRRTVSRRLAPGLTAAAGSFNGTACRLAVSFTVVAGSFARVRGNETVPVTRAGAAGLLVIPGIRRPLLVGLGAAPSATVRPGGAAGAGPGAAVAGAGVVGAAGRAAAGAGAAGAGAAGAGAGATGSGVGLGCAAPPEATASQANCTDVVAPCSW